MIQINSFKFFDVKNVLIYINIIFYIVVSILLFCNVILWCRKLFELLEKEIFLMCYVCEQQVEV